MKYPPFVDLLALSASYSITKKQKKLNGLLIQAWRAEACLGDLLQAKDCCKILRAKVNDKVEPFGLEEQTIVKALQTTAVSLYARATSTGAKPGERGSIKLDKKQMTDEQNADHKALILLRNQALAHVNREHKMGTRVWHQVVLFAVRSDAGQWIPAAATNETTWNRETLDCLDRMLPVAIHFVENKFRSTMEAVREALGDVGVSARTFDKFLFNPIEVFGSEAVVDQILNSRGKFSDRFWVDE